MASALVVASQSDTQAACLHGELISASLANSISLPELQDIARSENSTVKGRFALQRWLVQADVPGRLRIALRGAITGGKLRPINIRTGEPLPTAKPAGIGNTQSKQSALEPEIGPSPSAGPKGVTHSIKKKRRDELDPLIDKALDRSGKPDVAAIFTMLCAWADDGMNPPLLASTPQGIKYSVGGSDKYLTRDALGKRVGRRSAT